MAKRRIPWRLKCGAKRTNGEPCRQWSLYGCTRCRLHGGSSPQAQKKAQERIELVSRAAMQPALDALVERLTFGPRHKRLSIALAVLVNSGVLDEETADMIDPMPQDDPVVQPK